MFSYLWLAMEEAGDAMEADVLIKNRQRRKETQTTFLLNCTYDSFLPIRLGVGLPRSLGRL